MGDHQNPVGDRLEAAARALMADPPVVDTSTADVSLLRYFDYDDGNTAQSESRARMLRAAAQFRRCFLLPVPDAPGLTFFGGEADPAILSMQHAGLPFGNLAGSGLSPQRAFEACVGEGIEYLSQFLQTEDAAASGTFSEYRDKYDQDARRFIAALLASSKVDVNRAIALAPVHRLLDGAEVFFP